MKRCLKPALCFIILAVCITACTTKINPVATNGNQGPEPQSIIINNSYFGDFYSYEDTTKNYYNNGTLLLGNYTVNDEAIDSRVLLRYASLPDTVPAVVQDVTISMRIKENENDFDVESFQLFALKSLWTENTTTWAVADTADWSTEGGDFDNTLPIDFTTSVEDDTLTIYLESTLLTQWIEEDSLNFGLIMVSDQSESFVEFASAEATYERATELTFSYRNANETELSSFTSSATSDASINSSLPAAGAMDDLLMAYLSPTSMVLEVNMGMDVFPDSIITSEQDYHHMGIVRAELVMHVDDTKPGYSNSDRLSIQPYLLTTADPELPISNDNMASLATYIGSDTLDAGYYSIDITDIVDSVISGEFENHGIIVKPGYPSRDFTFRFFNKPDDPDPALRPYVRIIYIPPYDF